MDVNNQTWPKLRHLGILFALTVAGCLASQPRRTEFMKSRGVEISADELRERVFELGRHFIGIVEETAAQVSAGPPDATTRRNALLWQAGVLPLIEEAALRDDPLLSLGDLFALSIQQRDFFKTGEGRFAFGPRQALAVQATQQLVADAEQLALEIVGPKSYANARAAIEAWAASHPIRSLLFTRESAMRTWAAALGEDGGGVLTVAGSIDDKVAELLNRLAFSNENILQRMQWQTEIAVGQAFDANGLSSLQNAMEKALFIMTTLPKTTLAIVARERRAALAAIDEQRLATIAALESERQAVMTGLAQERATLVNAADEMRGETMQDLRGLVDHVFWRLLQLLAVAALMTLVAIVFSRYLPARSAERVESKRRSEEERHKPPPS